MSRVQSPDASFQLDEGTALQRLQNGLELGLSISKPTASARSAEILDAIDKMELKFPMLTSEGADDRVDTTAGQTRVPDLIERRVPHAIERNERNLTNTFSRPLEITRSSFPVSPDFA